jgi:hypothetical protein
MVNVFLPDGKEELSEVSGGEDEGTSVVHAVHPAWIC